MKIGIDSRAAKLYRGTGIGTYTYQLINYLNKIDNINEYLLFSPKNCTYNISLRNNFCVNAIIDDKKNNFWDEVNVPNILKDKDIQIYHVPQNGIGLPEDKNCSFIITLHDIIPYKMPETVSKNYLKIFREKIPQIFDDCDGIITVSNYSKDDIVKTFNFPSDKIYVTHLAAEDIYKPIDKSYSKNIIKKFYSIDEDFILYVGGFSPRKNILGLIDAFSIFSNKYKNKIKLVIAGKKGLSYDIYKKRVHELNLDDKVIFPGFISIEHLPCLYNAAELFVYPSFYEGFGLPPIEAMSCGIPVIASNTTSIPEVTNGGALLVDPNNTDLLSDSILKIILDHKLKSKLIKAGLVRASELTWQKTAEDTLKAYHEVFNKI